MRNLWWIPTATMILTTLAGAACSSGKYAGPWLQGWSKTIAGEVLSYHSPYPDVSQALLSRATDGTMTISWETAPIPADFKGETATFIWMCGLATQDGAHRFEMKIDGRPLLSFRTGKDASEKTWEIPGPNGVSLRFETTMVDQFEELFGFMFLTLPASAVTPGRPVRIDVTGENGGSRDWFMMFPATLSFRIEAAGEEALIRDASGVRQSIRLEISHIGPASPVEIVVPGKTIKETLVLGYNRFQIPAQAVASPADVPVEIRIDGRPTERLKVRLKPVVRRELWLLPHSHNDIGYSDRQDIVEKNHWAFFEKAMGIAERTASFPEEARFKWNSEVLWAVDSYLRQASPEKKAAFIRAVKSGRIGLQGLYANVLTGIVPAEELDHVLAFARRLSRAEGLTIDSVMITDIPTTSWSLIPVLAQNGIKYFSSGPNYMPRHPDGGDRIGQAMKAWADKPFYWVSPSGKEKILFWMAGRGYSWFHGLNMGSLSADKSLPILDYCRELAEKNYPYEMVQVRYTTGGDNGPPDELLPDFVRNWNERYESPRFRIAVASEMFAEFEKRHGAALPTVRGDFSVYWEDGAASTAREQALNREAARRLLSAEALWAAADPAKFPHREFAEAWRYVVFWDEHTWGAADSVSNPDGENARDQWARKKAFVEEADRRSARLLSEAVGSKTVEGGSAGAFDIFNPTGFTRREIVIVPKSLSRDGDHVVDEFGHPVPSQRLKNGDLAVQAGPVQPFGAMRFRVRPGEPIPPFSGKTKAEPLENGILKVLIDEKTGAVKSLTWKIPSEPEFVDGSGGRGLNEYLYVPGRDPKNAQGVESVEILPGEPGPLVASVIVVSKAPGARELRREYRLAAGSDRLEIINTLNKEKVREKESVHFAFPFRVPDGRPRLDLGWAQIRPDSDQIPGSNRDFFCVQNAVEISNDQYGLTWITLDAPLVEIGRMTDETPGPGGTRVWRTETGISQTVYSYAMNNYWHTNYKADQEGKAVFRFVIRPRANSDPVGMTRTGIAADRPMTALPAGSAAPFGSPLNLLPGPVLATALRPSADGKAVMVRLYNPSDRPAEASIRGRLIEQGTAYRSSPFEDRNGTLEGGRLALSPFEMTWVRIEPREKT
ncbi:MAG: hypothetical protein JW843_07010 [Candidatus Aminicenantes bacterium]|nr:hypothetical protein [Candidatus Aminicenantes bacterium]